MAYTIQISEEQRASLEGIINQHPEATGKDRPLEYWSAMLAQLPEDEAENPGILHGFCL